MEYINEIWQKNLVVDESYDFKGILFKIWQI